MNLDDPGRFVRVLRLEVPWARTWADTRPGHTDRERREELRQLATTQIPPSIPNALWWAFRITVRKLGKRAFDIENVPKPIIDSFCKRQIERDGSAYPLVALYPDDSLDYVRFLQVDGSRADVSDSTLIEVFACVAV